MFSGQHQRQFTINYSRFNFFDLALEDVDFINFMMVSIYSISLLQINQAVGWLYFYVRISLGFSYFLKRLLYDHVIL